jgi:hypothetical protein
MYRYFILVPYVFSELCTKARMKGCMFNIDNGYLEGLCRGFKNGILRQADYLNLVQCETLEDLKLHLQVHCHIGSYCTSVDQCCGSMTFRIRIRILDPDPAIFVIDLQAANKMQIVKKNILLINF